MTTEQRASFQRIVDMFLPDEEHHWDEWDRPADHIVHDLRKLKEFLDTPPDAQRG